jgi:hypothetical protein
MGREGVAMTDKETVPKEYGDDSMYLIYKEKSEFVANDGNIFSCMAKIDCIGYQKNLRIAIDIVNKLYKRRDGFRYYITPIHECAGGEE